MSLLFIYVFRINLINLIQPIKTNCLDIASLRVAIRSCGWPG